MEETKVSSLVKLKYLFVRFTGEIEPYEIPAFRGAIIDKVGKENTVLFHNHMKDGFRYAYPLIQYKRIGKNPAIICIGEGVDEIHRFFEQRNWNLFISERLLEIKIEKLELNQFVMQAWDKYFPYKIANWIALDQDSYKVYKGIEDLAEKINFLETKLVGNILSMAKGIHWTVDKTIVCKITEMGETKLISYKGVKMQAFNLSFYTNVFIPKYLGLGKSASVGLGVVYPITKPERKI